MYVTQLIDETQDAIAEMQASPTPYGLAVAFFSLKLLGKFAAWIFSAVLLLWALIFWCALIASMIHYFYQHPNFLDEKTEQPPVLSSDPGPRPLPFQSCSALGTNHVR